MTDFDFSTRCEARTALVWWASKEKGSERVLEVSCSLLKGHEGPHKETVIWE